MKTGISFFALLSCTAWVLLTGLLDPNNPPAAKTGAPGESTCAQSGCHSGGSYTGTVTLSGLPDTVTTGQAYSITLTNASNAVRSGFELTCLDANNTASGTFTNGTGTSNTTSNGRRYIRQASPHTLSGGSTSWTFTWTAPATLTTDHVTFYFVSLCANGNGSKSGDNVLQATRNVVMQNPVSTDLPSGLSDNNPAMKIKTLDNGNALLLELGNDTHNADFALFDLNGQVVVQQHLDSNHQIDLSQLPKGIYIAKMTTANMQQVVEKIVKQ